MKPSKKWFLMNSLQKFLFLSNSFQKQNFLFREFQIWIELNLMLLVPNTVVLTVGTVKYLYLVILVPRKWLFSTRCSLLHNAEGMLLVYVSCANRKLESFILSSNFTIPQFRYKTSVGDLGFSKFIFLSALFWILL